HTSIAMIHLELEKLVLLEKAGVSLREPFFIEAQNCLQVGCIGLQELPYKLGLVFCTNRISYLFGVKVSSNFSEMAPNVEPEMLYGESGQFALSSPRVFYDHQSHRYDG